MTRVGPQSTCQHQIYNYADSKVTYLTDTCHLYSVSTELSVQEYIFPPLAPISYKNMVRIGSRMKIRQTKVERAIINLHAPPCIGGRRLVASPTAGRLSTVAS